MNGPAPGWIADALRATLAGGEMSLDALATELLERLPLERMLTQLEHRIGQVLERRAIRDGSRDLACHMSRVCALGVTQVLAEPDDVAPTFAGLYNDAMDALDHAGIRRAPDGSFERYTLPERIRLLAKERPTVQTFEIGNCDDVRSKR